MNNSSKPRIVVYGAGQYGQYVTRFAVEKGWPVVAAFNHAGSKVGQDIGRLAGLDHDLGVVVQDCDSANYDNLEADIAVVATTNFLEANIVAYRRLLAAGLNVVCHGGQSYYPYGNNPGIAEEIDTLAKQNNVTFTGGGIWDMSRIWSGILVLGPCTGVTSLFHSSITDIEEQVKVKAHAALIGLGFTVAEFAEKGMTKNPVARMYATIPEHVLVASGYTIREVRAYAEPVTFDQPVYSKLLEDTIPSGRCVGSRLIGEVDTSEGVTARSEIELRLFQDHDIEHMFWSVDGKPRTRIRAERQDSDHATAACLFNRIPDVIAAQPGIVLVSQMGPLKHSALSQT
jgi:secondary-alkyl amine dehydrogenase [NAD(P)+]